jgi:hypothetical protein
LDLFITTTKLLVPLRKKSMDFRVRTWKERIWTSFSVLLIFWDFTQLCGLWFCHSSTSCFLDDDDAGSFGSGERRTAVSIIDGQLWKPFPYFWTWGYAWWYHGGIMSVFLWYKRYQGGRCPFAFLDPGHIKNHKA